MKIPESLYEVCRDAWFVLEDYDEDDFYWWIPSTVWKTMVGLLGTKIAVTPLFDDDKTAGGLYIPDIAMQKCDQGIVKYVGPEVKEVQIGDHVLFSGYTGTTARIEDEGVLIIMHEEFVVCRILPPETDINGLYFRDAQGEYWEATYEMSVELIRRAMEERKIEAKAFKPHTIARG